MQATKTYLVELDEIQVESIKAIGIFPIPFDGSAQSTVERVEVVPEKYKGLINAATELAEVNLAEFKDAIKSIVK